MTTTPYKRKPWTELQVILDTRGMSQAELSRRAGLSPAYTNDMIRGRTKPSANARRKFAAVLDLPQSALLTEAERGTEYAAELARIEAETK